MAAARRAADQLHSRACVRLSGLVGFGVADEPRLTGWCGGPRAMSLAGRSPEVILQAAFDSLAVIFGSGPRGIASVSVGRTTTTG